MPKPHGGRLINRVLKRREREKEEYGYSFKREQQLAKDKFEDEKAKTEKEIYLKKEQMEKELAEREKAVSEKEKELDELQKKIVAFPKEIENAVNEAVRETTEKIINEDVKADEISTEVILQSHKKADVLVRLEASEGQCEEPQLLAERISAEINKETGISNKVKIMTIPVCVYTS